MLKHKKIRITKPLHDLSHLDNFREFHISVHFMDGHPQLQIIKNNGINVSIVPDGIELSYSNGVHNVSLLKISEKKCFLYGPIARLVAAYTLRIEKYFHITNVPENLLKLAGHTYFSDFGLAVSLTRKNTPIQHLYSRIAVAEPCSIYEITDSSFHYQGSFFYPEHANLETAKEVLLDRFQSILKNCATVYLLCTGGLDSRANLSLLLKLQEKFEFDIKLVNIDFSDSKYTKESADDHIDQELSKRIADELNLELTTYSFCDDALDETRFKLYTDNRFLRQNPVLPRPDTAHFFYLLTILKQSDPEAAIVGLQTDFHKGSKYHLKDDFVAGDYESLKVSERWLGRLMGEVGYNYSSGKQDIYLKGLKERVDKFISTSAKVDYIVLETFVSNFGLSRSMWSNLFGINFPFLDPKFANIVVNMMESEKVNGNIPRRLIGDFAPSLGAIPFNSGTLYPKRNPFRKIKAIITRIVRRLNSSEETRRFNVRNAIIREHWKSIKYNGNNDSINKLMNWLEKEKNWIGPTINLYAVQMLVLKLIYIEQETNTGFTIE